MRTNKSATIPNRIPSRSLAQKKHTPKYKWVHISVDRLTRLSCISECPEWLFYSLKRESTPVLFADRSETRQTNWNSFFLRKTGVESLLKTCHVHLGAYIHSLMAFVIRSMFAVSVCLVPNGKVGTIMDSRHKSKIKPRSYCFSIWIMNNVHVQWMCVSVELHAPHIRWTSWIIGCAVCTKDHSQFHLC